MTALSKLLEIIATSRNQPQLLCFSKNGLLVGFQANFRNFRNFRSVPVLLKFFPGYFVKINPLMIRAPHQRNNRNQPQPTATFMFFKKWLACWVSDELSQLSQLSQRPCAFKIF